jgi:hypothetical protein
MPGSLPVLGVFRDALRIYRHEARVLLLVALVATAIPTAIELAGAAALPDLASSLFTSAVDNLAAVVFAGAAEELVHRWREGDRRIPLRIMLAGVPPVVWPLFVVAAIQGLGIAAGLALLVIPGLLLLTWWSVAGPVVVAERPGIRAAFRRSLVLVRGNAWRVLLVMIAVELLAAGLGEAASAIVDIFTHPLHEDVALTIGEAITLPLEGLVLPVMYWRLRELECA